MHVVVVGSGMAGLTAAIRASARHDVTLIAKGALTDAATTWAQGGVAAALGADDTTAAHIADTIAVGGGVNARRAVEVLCTDGPARVRDLLIAGVPFDRTSDPLSIDRTGDGLARGQEAAHSRRRIVHVGGDATGRGIETALIHALYRQHVTVLERTFLIDLVVRDGAVAGVDVLDLLGEPQRIGADAVILASGGAGHLYRFTTNPLVATGDGLAAAWRAGAVLTDLEFMQFHPTRLAVEHGGLVSEAVRGEGAVLRDAAGHRFMTSVHPAAELAPRDVVARGIAAAIRAQDDAPVLLDATGLGADLLTTRFPGLTRATRDAGFDWTREPVPVAPAAHYFMGGVATDTEGRTSVPGLLAIGEVACTGVHGANRLASNSLLEGLVFGVRAADALGEPAPGRLRLRGEPSLEPAVIHPPYSRDGSSARRSSPSNDEHRSSHIGIRSTLQAVMEARVGLLRDAVGLGAARRELAALAVPPAPATVRDHEDRNLHQIAGLVARAAEARKESRGAHARTDHPDLDTALARPLAWVAASAPHADSAPPPDTEPRPTRHDRVSA